MHEDDQDALSDLLTGLDEDGYIEALSAVLGAAITAPLETGRIITHLVTTLAHTLALASRAEGMFPDEIEAALDQTVAHLKTLTLDICSDYDKGRWSDEDGPP